MLRIGVAVSGGGHRATAWALGSLAALVETGANADVVSVSSVSGGSIANGAVARAGDFRDHRESSAFAAELAPTLRVVASEGLFFPGPATRAYITATLGFAGFTAIAGVGLLAALIAAGRDAQLVGFAAFGAVVGAAIGWVVGGLVRWPRLAAAAISALLGGVLAWGGAALTTGLHGGGLWATLVALGAAWLGVAWLAVVLFSGRGKAVEKALANGLLRHPTEARPLTLADVASGVNHVVCATDLESADQFYFAPRFLYGYREGISTAAPSRVTLATAVQASAALPGAFPPSIVATGPFVRDPSITDPATAPERVVLSDGGVYDNMADQWESGLATRLRVCEPLRSIQEPADVLVVANASEGWDWKPFTVTGRLARELVGLLRDQGVQYDVSTSRRRNQLIERFRVSRETGKGLVGVIVMIDRIPMSLAAAFAAGDDDVARRAREAVAFLDAQHSDAEWKALAARNATVPTTLGPIGVATTLDLMEHAYTSTAVGLYVLHGIGSLALFPRAVYAAAMEARP
ncbi:MAG: hypothetical protein KY443_09445 [Actinobacteria bacterium]|nr:hypothetical protein [Actinomycetota bacterium]